MSTLEMEFKSVSITICLALFIVTLFLSNIDVEVSQLITHLAGADYTNVVPQLILFQKFLGQIFKVSEE